MQCWLYHSANDREHHDVDLFAFKPDFLQLISGVDPRLNALFLGGFTQEGIVAYSSSIPIPLQVIRGGYFDAEIIPGIADVCVTSIGQTDLLALSPEFIAVCQLSYPNIKRSASFQDVLALNLGGCLRNSESLSALLMQTALGKLIVAQDILSLKTQDDLQALMDSIHRQLIKRFLYWDRVNIDALNPFQFFVLLDMGDELFSLPSDALQFIDTMLRETTLDGRKLQKAKLGLHFMLLGIPFQGLTVLQSPAFLALIRRGLARVSENPDFWLSRTKNILMTLQHMGRLENLTGMSFELMWSPTSLIKIVQRILFDDPSRLILLTAVRAIYRDLEANQIQKSECARLLYHLFDDGTLVTI